MVAALAGGVLWSNVLGYHDVTLAPRARLAELQHIGGLVAGKGPTFVNEYEVYADRHFLREGAPVEPAEYRTVTLPLRDGAILTKARWADLDSFPLSTLEPYRSIVTRRSPAESRPPSIYQLVWQGRYYQLWQRPAQPASDHPRARPARRIQHAALLRRRAERAERAAVLGQPRGDPPVRTRSRASPARRLPSTRELVAYQRPAPIVARGDQTLLARTAGCTTSPDTRSRPRLPGTAIGHIAVAELTALRTVARRELRPRL